MKLKYLVTDAGAYLVTETATYLVAETGAMPGWVVPPITNAWSLPMQRTGWTVPGGLVFGWLWQPLEANLMATTPTDIERVQLKRYSGWNSTWYFDFKNLPQIIAGQTISSAGTISVVAGGAGLTVGSGTVSGTQVTFKVSGGTAGVNYTLSCPITLSGGDVVTWEGDLYCSN